MNIHIKDENLFNNLKDATIFKMKIGSHLYKTNNINSDTDYLYIYATSKNELLSYINSHHQLQYKENNVDYIFVSLHNFMKNIINGDSPINFEVIQTDEFNTSCLSWISDHKTNFITYTTIRSYLGICRRDIKQFHKLKNKYERDKKLKHIIRGYLYAKNMFENNFDFYKCNSELINIEIDSSNNKQLRYYEDLISNLRTDLNYHKDNNLLQIPFIINVDKSYELNSKFIKYCDSDHFKILQNKLNDFNMDIFINALENWISYENI